MKDAVSEGLLVALNKLKNHIEARDKDLDHDIQVFATWFSYDLWPHIVI